MPESDFFGIGILKSGLFLILLIFGVSTTLACCIAGSYFYRKFSKRKVQSSFTPPVEWTTAKNLYVDAKKNGKEKAELRKLLMRLAICTIPLLSSSEEEGKEIEKLYKKQMMTRRMYERAKDLRVFIEVETEYIRKEAASLENGWNIFRQAAEFYALILQKQQNEAKKNGESVTSEKNLKKKKKKKPSISEGTQDKEDGQPHDKKD